MFIRAWVGQYLYVMIYPDMRLFPSVGASGFQGLISRQAFCGGSLGLRHQYVYELLQGTPLTEVTQASCFTPVPFPYPGYISFLFEQ
jgi:hypothetical protein